MYDFETMQWYNELLKPNFAPPSWVFGPVWSVLYILIAISFGYTIFKAIKGDWSKYLLIPLFINGASNLLFTPLQFGLRSNLLALLDILIVLFSLIWFMVVVRKKSLFVFFLQVPYLLWVSFATVLQVSITYLNK